MINFHILVREQLKELSGKYDKSENDLKALQSVGQVCLILLHSFFPNMDLEKSWCNRKVFDWI